MSLSPFLLILVVTAEVGTLVVFSWRIRKHTVCKSCDPTNIKPSCFGKDIKVVQSMEIPIEECQECPVQFECFRAFRIKSYEEKKVGDAKVTEREVV